MGAVQLRSLAHLERIEHKMSESLILENLRLLTRSQCLESEYPSRGKISDLYNAFMVVSNAGESVRSELEIMLQSGTPSGRIYAAILLRKIDPLAGENALKQLQGDRDIVGYAHGCIHEKREVSELVTEIFQYNDF